MEIGYFVKGTPFTEQSFSIIFRNGLEMVQTSFFHPDITFRIDITKIKKIRRIVSMTKAK